MSEVMSRPAARTLLLNPQDNVAVALSNLDVGTDTAEGVKTIKRVPKGHKFAVKAIPSGAAIVQVRPDHRLQGDHPGRRLGA